MILVSSCSCACTIHWSQVLSREWRQAMVQLHMSDLQFYFVLKCDLYLIFGGKFVTMTEWRIYGSINYTNMICRLFSAMDYRWLNRGNNFSKSRIKLQHFLRKRVDLKISSAKYWPFCLGLNVLNLINIRNVRYMPPVFLRFGMITDQ